MNCHRLLSMRIESFQPYTQAPPNHPDPPTAAIHNYDAAPRSEAGSSQANALPVRNKQQLAEAWCTKHGVQGRLYITLMAVPGMTYR